MTFGTESLDDYSWSIPRSIKHQGIPILSSEILVKTANCVYIYGLVDPRDHLVRYIGQTADVLKRMNGHSKKPLPQMQTWFDELHGLGLTPYAILSVPVSPKDADLAEQEWIMFYLNQGALLYNNASPITLEEARAIVQEIQEGIEYRVIAEQFGITVSAIEKIKAGQSWVRITGGAVTRRQVSHRDGVRNGRAKLSEDDVLTIAGLLASGAKPTGLAALYGVSVGMIRHIQAHRNWKEVIDGHSL